MIFFTGKPWADWITVAFNKGISTYTVAYKATLYSEYYSQNALNCFLKTRVKLTRVSQRSFDVTYTVEGLGAENKMLATFVSTFVPVDTNSLRIVPFPEWYQEKYSKLQPNSIERQAVERYFSAISYMLLKAIVRKLL